MRHTAPALIALIALAGSALLAALPAGAAVRAAPPPASPSEIQAATIGNDGSPSAALGERAALTYLERPIAGVVLAWEHGNLVRLAGAHVGTGATSVRTDAQGRFSIGADTRTTQINVVMPGYGVRRLESTADFVTVLLRPVAVRAIYLPGHFLDERPVLDWVVDLAREGAITAVVIDIKDDAGRVMEPFATPFAREIGAAKDPGPEFAPFLAALDALDVYTVARIVTFKDRVLPQHLPATASRTRWGAIFTDGEGATWLDPFHPFAHSYVIDIAAAAATHFDEIQFDYIRFPGERWAGHLEVNDAQERTGAIIAFARAASARLHAVGAAVAFDTFGQTTVISDEDGIGQVLEDLAPYLDYYSPMLYPSTWVPGSFGFDYPPSEPYRVVLWSVRRAVERLGTFAPIVVRPWLQDFHDYQEQELPYRWAEVQAQIQGSADGGGQGFMLWDPSLHYQTNLLTILGQNS